MMIGDAFEIAFRAHAGQTDKAGEPYILHPVRVASRFTGRGEIAVALLHDVVEDTAMTLERLRNVFYAEVVDAIDAITKREGEEADDYLRRVKANPLATKIKLADIDDNTDLVRLARLEPDTVRRLMEKYSHYRAALTAS